MNRITIVPSKPGRWDVIYRGERVRADSRVPAFDACRHLASLGVFGRLEVYRANKMAWDFAIKDIAAGAGLTIKDAARLEVATFERASERIREAA